MPTNSQHGCSQIRYVETGGFEVMMPVILSIPIVVDIAPTEHFSVGVFISSLVAWAKIHGCASRRETAQQIAWPQYRHGSQLNGWLPTLLRLYFPSSPAFLLRVVNPHKLHVFSGELWMSTLKSGQQILYLQDEDFLCTSFGGDRKILLIMTDEKSDPVIRSYGIIQIPLIKTIHKRVHIHKSIRSHEVFNFLWNSLVLMHCQVAMLILPWLTLLYSVFSFQGLSSCRAKTTSLGYPRRLHSLYPWKHWHFYVLFVLASRFHVFLSQHITAIGA